jgi:hypothetical protein
MVHRVLLSFVHAHLNPEGRTPLAAITDEALAAVTSAFQTWDSVLSQHFVGS